MFSHDSAEHPRAIDGFSLFHISFGLLVGSVLDAASVEWWTSLSIIFALSVVWEVVEYQFSTTFKPFFGLPPDEKDSLLNVVCDVLVALAGFGLSVAIPWFANLITGGLFLCLGLWWWIAKTSRSNANGFA